MTHSSEPALCAFPLSVSNLCPAVKMHYPTIRMSSLPQVWISPQEYIELEDQSDCRHEYNDGQMFAMSGGTMPHSAIQMNFGREISQRLKSAACRPFNNDLRILVEASGLMTYPDFSIFCNEPQLKGLPNSFVNPTVLVEVISPTNELFDRDDRGRKFDQYRLIPSLEEYVLISQNEYAVDQYIKQPDGGWRYVPLRGELAVLKIAAAEIEVPLAEIYFGVVLEDGERGQL